MLGVVNIHFRRREQERAKPEEYNFDRPAAFDWDLATKVTLP